MQHYLKFEKFIYRTGIFNRAIGSWLWGNCLLHLLKFFASAELKIKRALVPPISTPKSELTRVHVSLNDPIGTYVQDTIYIPLMKSWS